MKDKIQIRTNEEYIESVTITDDKGNIENTDILNVAKIEQENLVEFLQDKLKKLKALRENKEKKKDRLAKWLAALVAIYGIFSIGALVLSFANVEILSFTAIDIGLSPMLAMPIIAVAMIAVSAPYIMDCLPVCRTKYDDAIDDLENDLQEAKLKLMILSDSKTKESICEFKILSKLSDDVNTKYSLEYGNVYMDADYKYDRIMNKKEAKAKKAYYESIDEYVNYDEPVKTLGSKKKI